MGFFKDDKGGTTPSDKGTSAQTWVPAGSYPTMPGIGASKIGIETSAPADAHTQGRDVAGSMKQG